MVFCLLVLAADYLAYPRLAHIGGRSFNTGKNGLWLRYTWYFGKWQETDLEKLAGRLQSGEIRYGYFHVRDVTPDGDLRYRYLKSARRLTAALRRQAPGVKAIAWVYVGNERSYPSSRVDLADATVRRSLVAEAAWLVDDCGFDGVQWDYEVCGSGDQRLIALLEETRAALPEGKIISVCTPMWYPWPWPRSYCWDERYFATVAAKCDQLTVMCYDSALYLPRAYVWLVRQQATRVPRAVARGNQGCRVILGVPTYGKGGASHHARAEGIRMALKGVREGLTDKSADHAAFAGVSLFADYTTTPDEWQEWSRLWLERGTTGPRRGLLRAPR